MKIVIRAGSFFATMCVFANLCLAAKSQSGAEVKKSVIPQYEKFELEVPVPEEISNPFDPAQISIVAEFATPSKKAVRIPAFYYQPFIRTRDQNGKEILKAVGKPVFKVRFAWGEIGRYRYRVLETRNGKRRRLKYGAFQVISSAKKGFISVKRKDTPAFFSFDSGEPYFAIGENICWPGDGGTYDYDIWMTKLADNGGNYLRLWLINEWNKLALEHLSLSSGDGNGVARYDQEAAWRIDYILDLAAQLDMEVMLCIDSFNSLDSKGIYAAWHRSPYNSIHGGPCKEPADFFVDKEAKQLFRQRLRYIVARWGYATQVMAWELWNEVDLTTDYKSADVSVWHKEMSAYLKQIDPWSHLVTTSFSDTYGDIHIDAQPNIDFVQSHSYGSRDIAGMTVSVTQWKDKAHNKPHFIGEFGIDWLPNEYINDPTGLHLHNALWASLLSGSAGTAMTWWWDNYIEPNNLYHHFSPIAAFAKGIDWVGENYSIANPSVVRYASEYKPNTYGTVDIVPAAESWEEHSLLNRPHTFKVSNDGSIDGFKTLSRVQHGIVNHPSWHNPSSFFVDFPVEGRVEVNVSGVSGWGGGKLVIYLDGKKALTVDFKDSQPEVHETMHQYDASYSIRVPAGKHLIKVENVGKDWFYCSYRLTNYKTIPNLRVAALSSPSSALLWVQNMDNTWWKQKRGVKLQSVPASEIILDGFIIGEYKIEQWDTYRARIINTNRYKCTDGTILLTTPDNLISDVGYKVLQVHQVDK